MSDRHSFGNAVRAARKAKGISLRTLADELGYSAPFVSDVENGRRKPFIDPKALLKLSELLAIDIDRLQSLASLSRHGAFLIPPHVSTRHDEVAAVLIEHWGKLTPKQLAAIRKTVEG